MYSPPEITFFFRKKIAGAFSINQIFEALAAEIGKSHPVHLHNLSKAGGSLPKVLSNIIDTAKHSSHGINHITGDVHYIALGLHKGRTVLTVHDCVLLHRLPRRRLKFYAYLWFWYKWPIKKAHIVTTISEKSKSEIVSFTGCHPDKIVVIPNFVNEIFRPCPKEFDVACPRILHIGVNPNKNLERLTKALEGTPCILEIIGNLNKKQQELLKSHRIRFENYSNLSIEAIAERYRQADMVVFASTYEGFGMPVVEAQATGRPVVTSNIEPMMWVAGTDGACFVNPFDVSSMRAGIERIIKEKEYRDNLIRNGIENVKRFSINKVAGQYMEIYRRLLMDDTSKAWSGLVLLLTQNLVFNGV